MSRTDFSLSVISFATALALFFALPEEPHVNLGLIYLFIAMLLLMLAYLGDRLWMHRLAWGGVIVALGFAWAQFTTLAQFRGTGTPPVWQR